MDKNKLMEQLRKAVRDVIQEELGKSSYDAKSGISTTALTKDGKPVGYIKHTTKDGKFVAGGRIGKKAVEKMEKTDETTITIPVAALPSYKKGQQPTVINPQTGEEEVVSDVSSWAKKADENKYSLPAGSMKPKEPVKPKSALEKRFGHLKPGESASLKGDPQDVKKAPVKESNTLIDKMEKTGTPKSDDKDIYSLVFGKKRPRGKGSKSVEDKAREMGQMDMFTLEEFIGMLEEAGYDLKEGSKAAKDAYIMRLGRAVGLDGEDQFDSQAKRSGRRERIFASPDPLADREPGHMQRAVKAGEYDDVLGRTSLGQESPLGDTPKARYRNPFVDVGTYMRRSAMTDRPQLPESYTLEEWIGMMEEAGYSLDERNKENKAKKDAEIADTGWALRGQPGGAKGGTPNDELVKNKQRGRKDAKTVYGDKYDRQPGRYIPKTELGKSLLKGLKPK